jgi:hypothetical protein
MMVNSKLKRISCQSIFDLFPVFAKFNMVIDKMRNIEFQKARNTIKSFTRKSSKGNRLLMLSEKVSKIHH